jgi:hypothetical protein
MQDQRDTYVERRLFFAPTAQAFSMPDAETLLRPAGIRTDDGTLITCQGAFGVAFGLDAATAEAGVAAVSAAAPTSEMTTVRDRIHEVNHSSGHFDSPRGEIRRVRLG